MLDYFSRHQLQRQKQQQRYGNEHLQIQQENQRSQKQQLSTITKESKSNHVSKTDQYEPLPFPSKKLPMSISPQAAHKYPHGQRIKSLYRQPYRDWGISVQSPQQFHLSRHTLISDNTYISPYEKYEENLQQKFKQAKTRNQRQNSRNTHKKNTSQQLQIQLKNISSPKWTQKVDPNQIETERTFLKNIYGYEKLSPSLRYRMELSESKTRFLRVKGEFSNYLQRNSSNKLFGPLIGKERSKKRYLQTKNQISQKSFYNLSLKSDKLSKYTLSESFNKTPLDQKYNLQKTRVNFQKSFKKEIEDRKTLRDEKQFMLLPYLDCGKEGPQDRQELQYQEEDGKREILQKNESGLQSQRQLLKDAGEIMTKDGKNSIGDTTFADDGYGKNGKKENPFKMDKDNCKKSLKTLRGQKSAKSINSRRGTEGFSSISNNPEKNIPLAMIQTTRRRSDKILLSDKSIEKLHDLRDFTHMKQFYTIDSGNRGNCKRKGKSTIRPSLLPIAIPKASVRNTTMQKDSKDEKLQNLLKRLTFLYYNKRIDEYIQVVRTEILELKEKEQQQEVKKCKKRQQQEEPSGQLQKTKQNQQQQKQSQAQQTQKHSPQQSHSVFSYTSVIQYFKHHSQFNILQIYNDLVLFRTKMDTAANKFNIPWTVPGNTWSIYEVTPEARLGLRVIGTKIELRFEGTLYTNIENLSIMLFLVHLYKQWIPFCKDSFDLLQVSPLEKVAFMKFKFPFFTERYAYFHGMGIDRIGLNDKIYIFGEGISETQRIRHNVDGIKDKIPKEKLQGKDSVVLDMKYFICELGIDRRGDEVEKGKNKMKGNGKEKPAKQGYTFRTFSEMDSHMPNLPEKIVQFIMKQMGGMIFSKVLKMADDFKGTVWEKELKAMPKGSETEKFCRWLHERIEEWHKVKKPQTEIKSKI